MGTVQSAERTHLIAASAASALVISFTFFALRPLCRGPDCFGREEDTESEESDEDLEDLASRPVRLGMGEVLRRKKRGLREVDTFLASNEATLPGRQKIHVKTFGCPHNQSDGEYLCGQLQDYGYSLVDSLEESDAVVINSCTVKHPSETRALNLVSNAQKAGKGVVLAGCVPSSNRKLVETLEGVSMLDVSQLDRIVEVVEETVKGHTVQLMEKRTDLPSLSLPKVRKHRLAEIITINSGCFGNCTYCKTKMSRGKVVSYPIDTIIQRALELFGMMSRTSRTCRRCLSGVSL